MADVHILSVDEYLAKLETQDQTEAKKTLARKKQHDEQQSKLHELACSNFIANITDALFAHKSSYPKLPILIRDRKRVDLRTCPGVQRFTKLG